VKLFRWVVAGCLFVSASVFAEETIDKQCVPDNHWVTSEGQRLGNKSVIAELSKTKVVLLGEDHDNAEHHRWQLHTIAEMYALEPNLVLGFEAFPRATQKYLDKWVAGQIEEKEFLDAVEWERIWRFNKDHYMPMFHFARMNKIPMYALNVERQLVSEVGQKGWDNVADKVKEGVSKPVAASQDYLDVLAEVFAQHMPKHGHKSTAEDQEGEEEIDINAILENPAFQNFVQGQLVWDRAMAEIIYKAIEKDKKPVMVGVMGAGHIMGGYGVPHQLKGLGLSNTKTLMPWDGSVDCQQLKDGAVDIAYGIAVVDTESLEEQERPRLGVYLEHQDNAVIITRLVEGSVAQQTGIKVDDQIVTIAGKPVTKVTDVVEAVKATAFGTWLPIIVKRGDQNLEIVAKFPAKL